MRRRWPWRWRPDWYVLGNAVSIAIAAAGVFAVETLQGIARPRRASRSRRTVGEVSTPDAITFLRAVAELSSAAFNDALTHAVRELAAALERGEARDVGAVLDPIRGALLNRVRIAVEQPTHDRLRRLWIVVGYGGQGLQPELEERARAWVEANGAAARAHAAGELRAWFRSHEGAISRALRGPFAPLGSHAPPVCASSGSTRARMRRRVRS